MKKSKIKKRKVIHDYDSHETGSFIDAGRRLKFEDLGLCLPKTPPTQVVSIRIPSELLHELRAIGSQQDVPYQALIKILLAQGVAELKKKAA